MNCFELIKTVLDELYATMEGDDAAKDKQIKEALDYLGEQYAKLVSPTVGALSYTSAVTRFAYIFRYVTSHANLVMNAIEREEELAEVFDEESVHVTCLGGGPGSDFLGILKYLLANEKTPEIKFRLMDKEAAWAESWEDVEEKVKVNFRIANYFHPVDVTQPATWADKSKFLQSNLFTMVYFASEVYRFRDSAEQFFMHVFNGAPSGAIFLIIDNNAPTFRDWVDGMAKKAGLKTVGTFQGEMAMEYAERMSTLEEYTKKFGRTKLKPNIFYRVFRKP